MKEREDLLKTLFFKPFEQIQQVAHVDPSTDLETEVIQLRKSNQLLMMNYENISKWLEEVVPVFSKNTSMYSTLNSNYRNLLTKWNKYVSETLVKTDSNELLFDELECLQQENACLTNRVQQLEELVIELRQLLASRGVGAIPDFECISTQYKQRIDVLEKQLEELQLVNQQVVMNNTILRENKEFLETKQGFHNDQIRYYSQKVQRLNQEIAWLKAQLQQFDQAKLEHAILLGEVESSIWV